MKYAALFRDSWRETLDCKSLWVLAIISTILILLCASLSFTLLTPEEALSDVASHFHQVMLVAGGSVSHREFPVKFQVDEAREVEKGQYSFRVKAGPEAEVHALIRTWEAASTGKITKLDAPVPDGEKPVDVERQKQFIVARLREQQLTRVKVEPAAPEGEMLVFRVHVRPLRPELVHGAHRVGFLFGAVNFRLSVSAALMVAGIESLLANVLAGLGGIVFACVVTASFVPDMLQKGRIDILLTQPMGRTELLLCKYMGGLLYVLGNAIYLVGGCWLALALRSGHWDGSFLWSIPVLTAAFAVLYSFSVWLGVITRNTTAAMMSTLGLLFGSWAVAVTREKLAESTALSGAVRRGIEGAYWVLPKMGDLGKINGYLIARGNMGIEALEGAPMAPDIAWAGILASSAAFLVLFLSLACVSFSRRDY